MASTRQALCSVLELPVVSIYILVAVPLRIYDRTSARKSDLLAWQVLKVIRYSTKLALATALKNDSSDLAVRLKEFETSIGTSRCSTWCSYLPRATIIGP